MKILFLHGANLNNLGNRDIIYGDFSYDELIKDLAAYTNQKGANSDFFVSNHEGEIIDRIQKKDYDALIINPGAYAHYSLAIADALADISVIKIEVHITNVHKRGRHRLVTGAACDGVITGLKKDGYYFAIDQIINKNTTEAKGENI